MCNQPLHPPCPNNSKSTATSKTGLRIMLSSWIRGRSRCTGFFQLNNWFRLISCFHDCSCLGLVDFKALRTSRDHRQVDPTQQNDLFTNRSPASKTDSPPQPSPKRLLAQRSRSGGSIGARIWQKSLVEASQPQLRLESSGPQRPQCWSV